MYTHRPKTSVTWLAQWGIVRMSAGLQTPKIFLKVKRPSSWTQRYFTAMCFVLRSPLLDTIDLAADESTHNCTFRSIPKSMAKDCNPNPSAARFKNSASPLDVATVLWVLLQPRRQDPSTTSTPPLVDFREALHEHTCTTSALNSWPNKYSERKSGYCKRYRAGLLSRPNDDCFGAAISRQASFAANWTSTLSRAT